MGVTWVRRSRGVNRTREIRRALAIWEGVGSQETNSSSVPQQVRARESDACRGASEKHPAYKGPAVPLPTEPGVVVSLGVFLLAVNGSDQACKGRGQVDIRRMEEGQRENGSELTFRQGPQRPRKG